MAIIKYFIKILKLQLILIFLSVNLIVSSQLITINSIIDRDNIDFYILDCVDSNGKSIKIISFKDYINLDSNFTNKYYIDTNNKDTNLKKIILITSKAKDNSEYKSLIKIEKNDFLISKMYKLPKIFGIEEILLKFINETNNTQEDITQNNNFYTSRKSNFDIRISYDSTINIFNSYEDIYFTPCFKGLSYIQNCNDSTNLKMILKLGYYIFENDSLYKFKNINDIFEKEIKNEK